MSSIAESIEGLIRVYRESLLLPNARAVDFSLGGYGTNIDKGSGGHGTHGERGRSASFDGDDLPVCVSIERDLARLLTVAKVRLESAGPASPNFKRSAKGDRVSAVRKAQKAAILAAGGTGTTAIEVAYLYGWAEASVRRAWLQNGRDPDTGERVRQERPITSRNLPEVA